MTAFADNEVGRLLEDFVLQGGVDTSLIRWVPYDGVGRTVRNGLNFTERGFGVRGAARRVRPRQHGCLAAAAGRRRLGAPLRQARRALVPHRRHLRRRSPRPTPEVVVEAVAAAKRHGTVVSYDLNYRPSLWKGIGGVERAREVNRRLATHIDVMIGNEEDFTACLGLEVEGADENLRRPRHAARSAR